MVRRAVIIVAIVVAATASPLGARSEASGGPGLNIHATAVASPAIYWPPCL
jgi:hypothetical protein